MIRAASALVFLALAVPSAAGGWNGDINLLLAGKTLHNDEWGPTRRQGEIGLQTNWQKSEWPLAFAADFLASGREHAVIDSGGFVEQNARTTELDLGARKIWRVGEVLRTYFGGGLALVSGELELRGPLGAISERDNGAGLWLGGGVFWTLGSVCNLGLDAKISGAGVNVLGRRRNAGGFHLGALVGYHWGG